MISSCADPENFLRGGPASEKDESDKVLPFQNSYPGKSKGGGGGVWT